MGNLLHIFMWIRSKMHFDFEQIVGYFSFVCFEMRQTSKLSFIKEIFLFKLELCITFESCLFSKLLNLHSKLFSFIKSIVYSNKMWPNLWCHVLISRTIFARMRSLGLKSRVHHDNFPIQSNSLVRFPENYMF